MASIGDTDRDVLLREVEGIVSGVLAAAEGSCGDLSVVEGSVRDAVKALRSVLTQAGLSASVSSAPSAYVCRCGRRLVRQSWRHRRVVTSEGEGEMISTRWRCRRCRCSYYPVETLNGLRGSQFTTGAKGLIAGLGAELPYARVSALLSERGVNVSPKEVDRTVGEVSDWRASEEVQAVRVALPHRGQARHGSRSRASRPTPAPLHDWSGWTPETTAVISVDGAKVRSPEAGPEGLEWFEGRVGIIAPAEKDAGGSTFYVGGVLEPDGLFRRLMAASHSDPNRRRRTLFIAAGRSWIWTRAPLAFPRAREVLDIYHASEHLASAAAAVWGEQTRRARHWRRNALKMLLEPRGPSRALRELRAQSAAGTAMDPASLEREIRYFERHRERMPYAQLRAQGLPVGSGAMESGIKQTSTQRLRQPGMMWSRAGADRMLRLRATLLGGNLRHTLERRQQALAATLPLPISHIQAHNRHKS